MYWQYRTILFEFQKDGLLGDKYVDDEEMEKVLNEQGEQGWELVGVSTVQEGLLTFFKRVRQQPGVGAGVKGELPAAPKSPISPKPPGITLPPTNREPGAGAPRSPAPKRKSSLIGEIKIS